MSKLSRTLTPRVAVLITALAAVTTAGCVSGAAAGKVSATGPEKTNLVIAAVPTASSAGVYVAQRDGLFRQAGLNVKIVNISAGANVTPELLHGSIDVVNGAYAGFIQAQIHGAAQFHILADGYAGAPNVDEVVVLPKSGINSVKQLEGRTVAVNALGSVAQLLVSSALSSQGVAPSKVHFVAMGFPAMPAALQRHQIDAAYLAEPYLSQAEEQTGGEELLDVNQGATQDFPIDGYAATVQWCRKYPKTAAAVAKALDEGQALADTNRPLVEKALTKDTTITRQIAAIMALGDFPDTVDTVHLQRVPDLMQSFGLLKQRFSMNVMTKPVGS
ncbi:MAG: ABC transporter substrate-binding protein [Actinobacteria bacterium]|nr:ABC transporter substrate-binding protein [Actinomycetota bacterium]